MIVGCYGSKQFVQPEDVMNQYSRASSMSPGEASPEEKSPEEKQCWRAESSLIAATPLKWLDDCINGKGLNSHRSCAYLRERQRSLPKRLLDIGVVGKRPCLPKLIETSGFIPNDIEFVALSHVWGSLTNEQKEAMSTTPSSLLARQQGIKLAGIPLQYRAVLILCRCLHFQYLWIDSLCIIQSAGGDWAEESTRMASVYGSASLTIAVNTKQDLFDSIFAQDKLYARQEPPGNWVAQYKRCYSEDSSWKKRFAFHNFDKFLHEGGIIGGRAWCMQERHDNRVALWECPSLLANTATSEHFPFIEGQAALKLCKDRYYNLAMHQRYVDGIFYRKEGDDYQDPYAHLVIWHTMLRNMGYRHLTESSDNLTAIAGIAAQVHHNTGLTYLSGIWKEDIPRGLLWARTPGQELHYNGQWKRFSNYQGPSWSWCSVDGPTQLIEHNYLTQEPIGVSKRRDSNFNWRVMIHNVDIYKCQDSGISRPLKPLQRGSYLSVKGHLARFQCSGKEVSLSQCAGKDISSYVRDLGGGFNLSQVEEMPGDRVKGAAVFDLPEECTERVVWCLCLAEAPEGPGRFCAALVLASVYDLVEESNHSKTNHPSHVDRIQPPHDFRRVGLAFLDTQYSGVRIHFWTEYFGDEVQLRIF